MGHIGAAGRAQSCSGQAMKQNETSMEIAMHHNYAAQPVCICVLLKVQATRSRSGPVWASNWLASVCLCDGNIRSLREPCPKAWKSPELPSRAHHHPVTCSAPTCPGGTSGSEDWRRHETATAAQHRTTSAWKMLPPGSQPGPEHRRAED